MLVTCRKLSHISPTFSLQKGICYLMYLVIMLNPVLTKKLIKDEGNKYSVFLYCCFRNTVV